MTNRREGVPDPMSVGDTEDRLDHTGGGEALDNDVTPADEDYYRRHIGFPQSDEEMGEGQNGVPAPDHPERAHRSSGNAATGGEKSRAA